MQHWSCDSIRQGFIYLFSSLVIVFLYNHWTQCISWNVIVNSLPNTFYSKIVIFVFLLPLLQPLLLLLLLLFYIMIIIIIIIIIIVIIIIIIIIAADVKINSIVRLMATYFGSCFFIGRIHIYAIVNSKNTINSNKFYAVYILPFFNY